jgi:plasmanylethanolamine desaturase
MLKSLFIPVQIYLIILGADLFTGIIHWIEDRFWTEKTPLVGKWLIQPNELHHKKPTAFLSKTWWQSSYDAVFIGVFILIIAFLFWQLTWEIVLFVLISICACQVHKYSHQPPSRLPVLIRFLQRSKIIQDSSHHVKHHIGEKNSNYCLLTPVLNPLLNRIHFWKFMEVILIPVFGEVRK